MINITYIIDMLWPQMQTIKIHCFELGKISVCTILRIQKLKNIFTFNDFQIAVWI